MCIEGLQLMCNPNILDKRKTTATLFPGSLSEVGISMPHDMDCEGNRSCFHNIFKDGDIYRMYYLGWKMGESIRYIRVCYAESVDGVTWVKPNLGICEFNGNKNNNIILDITMKPNENDHWDNFFVFKDENPKCKKSEKYKALAFTYENNFHQLECYFSADAIHFRKGYILDLEGKFDTLNTCRYDKKKKKYIAYIRDFHDVKDNNLNTGIRDIRYCESKDFKNWSVPKRLNYVGMKEDYPLYTNNIMKYPGNQNLFVGFPTRYIERKEWTDNFDKLCGREDRLERMKTDRRYGLAITDCLFMLSDNGQDWHRFDTAFLSPGLENGDNWIYGDCYLAYGLIDGGDVYYMYMSDEKWNDNPSSLRRYKIRKDSFFGYWAGDEEKIVVTKKIKYEGKKMFINFETSAAGSVYVKIEDESGKFIKTCEMFGDSIRRAVSFAESEVEAFSGKNVKITFYLKDAKVYSFDFE